MNNLVTSNHLGRWVLSYCPSTGDEVIGSGWNKQFSTPTGQAMWWKCPACDGWHITTVSKPVQDPTHKCSNPLCSSDTHSN